MAQPPLTEAPLKRKLDDASEATDCKKAQQICLTEIDGNLAQSDGNVVLNGQSKLPSSVEPSGKGESKTEEIRENLLMGDVQSGKPSVEASGSGSARFADSEALGEGEVLEAALEQDDDNEEQGDDEEEMSEIDTENDSVDDEEEDAGSNEDSDEDDSDEGDSDEEDEDEMPTSTSSSLQGEAAGKGKGKGIEERKGKEKVVDVKGKGIMVADKGKGKAVAEDDAASGSDEDDAGYLSEDPLDEVDLNNILPSRTRRRSSSTHYDFVEHGGEDDDDDDDSDA